MRRFLVSLTALLTLTLAPATPHQERAPPAPPPPPRPHPRHAPRHPRRAHPPAVSDRTRPGEAVTFTAPAGWTPPYAPLPRLPHRPADPDPRPGRERRL